MTRKFGFDPLADREERHRDRCHRSLTKGRADHPFADKRVYDQFWRVIDGAVKDALNNHPEYLADPKFERFLRASVTKRVLGALNSYAALGAADPGS